MQEKIGFDNQGSLSGACAQRSLVHSLLLLGIPISKNEAHSRTGISNLSAIINGTTENSLIKGINRCNCIAYPHGFINAKETRNLINQFLREGMPVIISTENTDHWIVLAGRESQDNYYWIDSDDYDLYGYDSWTDIRDWMEYEGQYYFIGVRPKDDERLNHSLVKDFRDVYALFDDNELAEYWGVYLEDLSEIFDSPSNNMDIYSPEEFFSKYEAKIVDSLCYYNADAGRSRFKWEISNYLKVAIAHKMTLSKSKETDALIDMTVAMAYVIE
jgi:hypothetical protein